MVYTAKHTSRTNNKNASKVVSGVLLTTSVLAGMAMAQDSNASADTIGTPTTTQQAQPVVQNQSKTQSDVQDKSQPTQEQSTTSEVKTVASDSSTSVQNNKDITIDKTDDQDNENTTATKTSAENNKDTIIAKTDNQGNEDTTATKTSTENSKNTTVAKTNIQDNQTQIATNDTDKKSDLSNKKSNVTSQKLKDSKQQVDTKDLQYGLEYANNLKNTAISLGYDKKVDDEDYFMYSGLLDDINEVTNYLNSSSIEQSTVDDLTGQIKGSISVMMQLLSDCANPVDTAQLHYIIENGEYILEQSSKTDKDFPGKEQTEGDVEKSITDAKNMLDYINTLDLSSAWDGDESVDLRTINQKIYELADNSYALGLDGLLLDNGVTSDKGRFYFIEKWRDTVANAQYIVEWASNVKGIYHPLLDVDYLEQLVDDSNGLFNDLISGDWEKNIITGGQDTFQELIDSYYKDITMQMNYVQGFLECMGISKPDTSNNNKDELKNSIDDTNTILNDTGKYTEDSTSALEAALINAQMVYNNENVTQSQIDTAKSNLDNTLQNLQLANDDNNGNSDKNSALKSQIDNANDKLKNADKYTAATVEKLRTALATANSIYNNVNANQAQIDGAIASLNSAIKGLVAKSDSNNFGSDDNKGNNDNNSGSDDNKGNNDNNSGSDDNKGNNDNNSGSDDNKGNNDNNSGSNNNKGNNDNNSGSDDNKGNNDNNSGSDDNKGNNDSNSSSDTNKGSSDNHQNSGNANNSSKDNSNSSNGIAQNDNHGNSNSGSNATGNSNAGSTESTKTVQNGSESLKNVSVTTPAEVAKKAQMSTSSSNQSETKTLPQTGDKSQTPSVWAGIVGIIIAGFGFLGFSKRKHG
ncbi:LPXTG cell wall anchor domain-containing protein [Pediococcus pentosaceus]|uniref:LPXTG cell wall anchor domain-containing protein n=1 Tax=Pediococcus pentosaceus TaxID=1255 RepID=UPI0018A17759|nr:LPXTG cell wall anchor domain-containing protein [Pediococcus pentosaceus]MBF7124002.1 FIVAR domain-containing protein [Pediococcus pentosaceus]MCR1861114.1 LPXTG cell wall anchor domain-containing protein [Pediococcus pentosaceus]